MPVGLGQRDEAVGRQAPACRVLPADQRLDAGDPLRLELDERLVLEEQLVALQRQAELGAELHALDELRAHAGSKRATRPLPASLAAYIARSAFPSTSSAVSVGTGALHAEARRRGDLAPVEDDRRLERAAQALGDLPRLVGAREVLEQDGELVAAEPRGGVLGAQAARQSLRGRAQQLVADRVAEAVVDRLEVVEIDEDHRELAVVAPAARERQRQAILEQRPVGEAGEVVVERLVAELLLERDAIGDVAEVEQDPVDQRIADVVVRDHLDRSIVAVGGAQANAQRARTSAPHAAFSRKRVAGTASSAWTWSVKRAPTSVRGVIAQRAAHRLRDPAHLRGAVDHGDDVGGVADERVQSLLAAALGVARLLGDRGPPLDPVHPPAEEAQQQQADRQRTEPPEPRALLRGARDAVLLRREAGDGGVEATHGGSETALRDAPAQRGRRVREASSACMPWP